jgi:hypothetical protein
MRSQGRKPDDVLRTGKREGVVWNGLAVMGVVGVMVREGGGVITRYERVAC